MMIEMYFDFESKDDDFYLKSDDNFDFESNNDDFDFQSEIFSASRSEPTGKPGYILLPL